MKKILTTALILGSLYGTANAKVYLGADLGYTTVDLKKFEMDGVDKEKSASFGLNAGLNYTIANDFFVGAEAHLRAGNLYDEEYYSFTSISGQEQFNELTFTNPFGAKVFAGAVIQNKVELFASVGVELISYESNYWDEVARNPITGISTMQKKEEKETNTAMSFGLGVGYKISDHLNARLTYEHINYEYEDSDDSSFKVKAPIDTIRLGINYLF